MDTYTSESFQNLPPREYLNRAMKMLNTVCGTNVECVYGGAIRDVLNGEHPQDIDVKLNMYNTTIFDILKSVGVWKPKGNPSTQGGISGELCGVLVDFTLPRISVVKDFRCNGLWFSGGEIRGMTFDIIEDIHQKRLVPVFPVLPLEELVNVGMPQRSVQAVIIQRGRKMMGRGWTWDYPFPETHEAECCVSQETTQCIKLTCSHTISIDGFVGVLTAPNPRCPLCRESLGFRNVKSLREILRVFTREYPCPR